MAHDKFIADRWYRSRLLQKRPRSGLVFTWWTRPRSSCNEARSFGWRSGSACGEVLGTPVVPGPQFADHLWWGHGEHRAAGMSQAVAADSAVDHIPKRAPAPAAHHQQV